MSRTATAPLLASMVLSHAEPSRPPIARQQLLQHLAQIADQRHIHLDVLVDLGRVDFDVNLFGLGRVGARACR